MAKIDITITGHAKEEVHWAIGELCAKALEQGVEVVIKHEREPLTFRGRVVDYSMPPRYDHHDIWGEYGISPFRWNEEEE